MIENKLILSVAFLAMQWIHALPETTSFNMKRYVCRIPQDVMEVKLLTHSHLATRSAEDMCSDEY